MGNDFGPVAVNPFAAPADFVAGGEPPSGPGLWFGFLGSKMVVAVTDAGVDIPRGECLADVGIGAVRSQFLGTFNHQACYGLQLPADAALPAGLELRPLRGLYGQLDEALFAIAGRATQIVEWDRTHQYCGCCGTPLDQGQDERVKRCLDCGLRQYPRLSPAVIMLVYRGSDVLLARAPRFRAGMYSVLAGFVEPGESLEETVAREVREEVGVEITDIRYFGSQPWPFPNSLMIGFTARYAAGDIVIDGQEIEAAGWFTKDTLPPVPGRLSIARKLIDWFINEHT